MKFLVMSLFLGLSFGLTGCSKSGKRSDSSAVAAARKKAADAKAAEEAKKKADAASAEAQRQQQTQQEEARKKAESRSAEIEAAESAKRKEKEEADKKAEEQRRADILAKKAADDKKAAEEAESKKKAEAAAELKKRQEESDKKIAAEKAAAEEARKKAEARSAETDAKAKAAADAKPAEKAEPADASKAGDRQKLMAGKLEIKADEAKLLKNDQCGLELIKGSNSATLLVQLGGVGIPVLLMNEWIGKDSLFDKAAIEEASKKNLGTFVTTKPAKVNQYKVNFDASKNMIEILRRYYVVLDEKVKDLENPTEIMSFVELNSEKIIMDSNFKGMITATDRVQITQNSEGAVTSFTFAYRMTENGSGREQAEKQAGSDNPAPIQMKYVQNMNVQCK